MTDMEIETFLTVLRSGSMTAAAQALYITQPTLSARLQTLEDEVGTPLFVRGKGLRRLELTEAGTRFLPLAQRWQRLMAEMHGIAAAEARTHFRIGAAYTANQYVLPPVYKRFLERDLPVALRVETLSSQQAQEAVTRRELDMAIVEDDVGFNPELQVTPLFRESFYMICSEGSDYPELVNPHDLDMSQEINVSQRREAQVWNDYWFGPAARPLLNTDTVPAMPAGKVNVPFCTAVTTQPQPMSQPCAPASVRPRSVCRLAIVWSRRPPSAPAIMNRRYPCASAQRTARPRSVSSFMTGCVSTFGWSGR